MPVNPDQFKSALGRWGSGVAVVTTRDAAGAPVGLTASSFSSLSLHPPLVLFCLALDSTGRDAFVAAPGFLVHLLAEGQQALSQRFAAKGGDKFAGLRYEEGDHGPLLPSCLAALECRTRAQHPGGDHIIMVGEVEQVRLGEGEPLLYFQGRYRRLG